MPLPCLHKCFPLSTFNQISIKYSDHVGCKKYQDNATKFTLPIRPELERSVTYNKMKNFSKDEFPEMRLCPEVGNIFINLEIHINLEV